MGDAARRGRGDRLLDCDERDPKAPCCPECKARLRQDDEEPLTADDEALRELLEGAGGAGALLGKLVRKPNASAIPGLIFNDVNWERPEQAGADPIVEPLVAVCKRLPNLKAVFLTEFTADECEVSWIESPLLERPRVLDLSLGCLSDKGAVGNRRSSPCHEVQFLCFRERTG